MKQNTLSSLTFLYIFSIFFVVVVFMKGTIYFHRDQPNFEGEKY